jgi:hypothetical protein
VGAVGFGGRVAGGSSGGSRTAVETFRGRGKAARGAHLRFGVRHWEMKVVVVRENLKWETIDGRGRKCRRVGVSLALIANSYVDGWIFLFSEELLFFGSRREHQNSERRSQL